MKKKKIIIIVIIVTLSCVLLYLIGMYFLGGKNYSINLNSTKINEIITAYDITEIDSDDIISFEHKTYLQYRVNILKIERNDKNEELIKNNSHFGNTKELSAFGFPFPNCRFISENINECFYDEDYLYLSVYYGGTEYHNKINVLFWELYKQ